MQSRLKIVMPLAVLAFGVVGFIILVNARGEVETHPASVLPPLVRTQTIAPRSIQLFVPSQGSVVPRTTTTLVSQVAAKVTSVSPAFAEGGFFEKDETLVRLDDRDYQLLATQAEAQVAQARLRLAREQEEAQVAVAEWQSLGYGEAGPLATRQLYVAEAEAALAAAQASLEQAKLNLERTRIRAPFAGRVRTKNVDLGQFVNPGAVLAQVYSVDFAEIRLPIPDKELAYLELPMSYRGELSRERGPEVVLSAEFAGQKNDWRGYVARTDGEIDPRTRMVNLIARVENPYGRGQAAASQPPLAVGLFVQARIAGRLLSDAIVIPRAAMRGSDRVLVVDNEDRLRFRAVETLRLESEHVIIGSGLAAGERICLSPLDAVVDGMRVRTSDDSVPTPAPTMEKESKS